MSEIIISINGSEVSVPSENITQGIEKGKIEIVKDDLKVLKSTDFDTFKSNLATEEYKKGKVAGEEMLIKTAREKYALEFEGKTLDNLIEAYKNKHIAEASKEPTQKVKELSTDIEKLRNNLTEWENKYNSLNGSIENERKANKVNAIIQNAIPKEGTILPIEDIALLFKSKYNIDITENGHVVKQGENVLKNATTLAELTINDIMGDFIKPYIKTQSGGRGANDNAPQNKLGGIEAFAKEMESKGININSMQAQTEMAKRIKEGTLKL